MELEGRSLSENDLSRLLNLGKLTKSKEQAVYTVALTTFSSYDLKGVQSDLQKEVKRLGITHCLVCIEQDSIVLRDPRPLRKSFMHGQKRKAVLLFRQPRVFTMP